MLNQKSKKQLERLKPKIISWLKENVTQKRLNHISRVAKTAKKYAKKLKLDCCKAELAGWLHDCAKEMTNNQLLRFAKRKKIKMDEVDFINPHVLHARVGARIAKEQFGIKDPDILGGIRCHTLAEPKMSKLVMLLYLADATEPGRDKKRIQPIIKTFKKEGLEQAVLEAIEQKLCEVIEKGKVIHPFTINARNWLIKKIKM